MHGCTVYTERVPETAAVSRGTSHFRTKQRWKYTILVNIQSALTVTTNTERDRERDKQTQNSNGVHITCAETAAVSRGTSHVRTKQRWKYTILVNIQSVLTVTHSESHAKRVQWQQIIALYKSDQLSNFVEKCFHHQYNYNPVAEAISKWAEKSTDLSGDSQVELTRGRFEG